MKVITKGKKEKGLKEESRLAETGGKAREEDTLKRKKTQGR